MKFIQQVVRPLQRHKITCRLPRHIRKLSPN